jgi:signal transduction histidine kinase
LTGQHSQQQKLWSHGGQEVLMTVGKWQRNLSLRIASPTLLVSVLLLGLCAVAAVSLYRQQATTAEMLARSVVSRQLVHTLETVVDELVTVQREGRDEVEALHERIQALLVQAQELAEAEEEHRLVRQLEHSLAQYAQYWDTRLAPVEVVEPAAVQAAVRILETETLPLCRQLREYHSQQIEYAAVAHRQSVPWMAWGLAGVGSLGALAGVLLGYGVARRLRRSIQQLSIRVRDAAGKLGHDLPAVILTAEGDLHHVNEQMRRVVQEIARVVEQLQQREREVLRAKQMVAVGQLAAGVAHELRNRLTSIKMLVQTNCEEAAAHGLPAEDLQVIEEEIRRLERYLQTFLDFARPPQPARRPLSLATVVDQTFALLEGRARQQHVTLHCLQPAPPVIIEADADQLQQVLVNLLLNALDAMPGGGRVEIQLGAPVHGQVDLRVLDTGPGITPELLPRLFEPFVSSKETGLGLGLAVSRRIAESHGGNLWVTNPPHGGACFVLRLPVVAPNALVLTGAA